MGERKYNRYLSASDLETLRVIRADVSEFGILAPEQTWRSRDEQDDANTAWSKRAVALLDRLITNQPTPPQGDGGSE